MGNHKGTGYIFNYKKYAIHDGPGIRSTIFLQGCPLKCWWCHNPESRELGHKVKSIHNSINCLRPFSAVIPHTITHKITVSELLKEIQKDIIFYDQSGGGVTFSGGEPLLQIDFLSALLQECKKWDIHTAVDTSGYTSWKNFDRILNLVNLFLYDIKLIDPELHEQYTGISNHKILKNLVKLAEQGKEINLRIPLIPGITDTEHNLKAIAVFISSLSNIKRVDLLPYNPLGEKKYKKLDREFKLGELKFQKDYDLKRMEKIFTDFDFTVQIGG
jgi:pyruvate formate lyase activating enzyme